MIRMQSQAAVVIIVMVLFSHTVFSFTDCGVSQASIKERIQDCSLQAGSAKVTSNGVTWILVSSRRDASLQKFYEVWQDSKTGLVWGDRLDGSYTFDQAAKLGSTCHYEYLAGIGKVTNCDISEIACVSTEGTRASVGISDRKFGLPTIREYAVSESDGIRQIVPHMMSGTTSYFFWSSSLVARPYEFVRRYGGYTGNVTQFGYRTEPASVRCVGV